jgi:hypothetical protein
MSVAARRQIRAFGGNRNLLVYGTYKPDKSTTGVLPGIVRTDYNSPATAGLVTLSTAGVTYENLDFYGDIQLSASDVTFRNCFFHGGIGHPPNNRGCLTLYGNNNHNNTVLYDCTFMAQDPSYYRDGVVGNSYIAYRCEAWNTNDGFGAYSAVGGAGNCDVELYGCYAHDLVYWEQDPAHADGTHNDCLQYQGGSHLRVIGNHFRGYQTADPESTGQPAKGIYAGQCCLIGQVTHQPSDILIANNYFAGAYSQLNLVASSTWPVTVDLGPNHYDRDVYENYAPNSDKRWIAISGNSYLTANGLYTDQRFSDDNSLLTAGRATGIRILS